MAILPVYYFPPVTWFIAAFRQKEVLLETSVHYHKQEYYNRMRLPGPNKTLTLSVPVTRMGERVPLHESRISYEQNWQILHWRSIESAYRSSPYFEYYEDRLLPVFEQKFERLLDLNLHVLELLRDMLLPGLKWNFTKEYFPPGHYPEDYRQAFDPSGKKFPANYLPEPWPQVFGTKEPDPSILDLICNLGPDAKGYLNRQAEHFPRF